MGVSDFCRSTYLSLLKRNCRVFLTSVPPVLNRNCKKRISDSKSAALNMFVDKLRVSVGGETIPASLPSTEHNSINLNNNSKKWWYPYFPSASVSELFYPRTSVFRHCLSYTKQPSYRSLSIHLWPCVWGCCVEVA